MKSNRPKQMQTIHGLRLSQAEKIAHYNFGKDFIRIKEKSQLYYIYVKKSADVHEINKFLLYWGKAFRVVVDKKKTVKKKNKFEFTGEPFLK